MSFQWKIQTIQICCISADLVDINFGRKFYFWLQIILSYEISNKNNIFNDFLYHILKYKHNFSKMKASDFFPQTHYDDEYLSCQRYHSLLSWDFFSLIAVPAIEYLFNFIFLLRLSCIVTEQEDREQGKTKWRIIIF